MNASPSTKLFICSNHHFSAKGLTPPHRINAHNPKSFDLLWQRANARNAHGKSLTRINSFGRYQILSRESSCVNTYTSHQCSLLTDLASVTVFISASASQQRYYSRRWQKSRFPQDARMFFLNITHEAMTCVVVFLFFGTLKLSLKISSSRFVL